MSTHISDENGGTRGPWTRSAARQFGRLAVLSAAQGAFVMIGMLTIIPVAIAHVASTDRRAG